MNEPHEFEVLLGRWRVYEAQVREIYGKQDDLTDAISVAFAKVVRERQLLAPLKWDFSASSGSRMVEISCCLKKDDALQKLLDKFQREGGKRDYHATLKLGNHSLHSYTNMLRFYFDTIEQCVAFCKEQGIKLESSTLEDKRKKALSEAERLKKLIETLS